MNLTRASWWRLSGPALTILGLGLAWTSFSGCGGSKTPADAKSQTPAAKPSSTKPNEISLPASGSTGAQDVLKNMVAAYKRAPGYADAGKVHLTVTPDPNQISGEANFAVTFVRPNKIRMEVYQAAVVCDGKKFYAAVQDLPGQVLEREAPANLTLQSVHADGILDATLRSGFAGPPPQMLFLLADDPLKVLLQDAEVTVLEEPAKIADRDCYRVQVKRPDGKAVFWIDRESYALMRVEYPTDELAAAIRRGGRADEVSLVAEFAGARFGDKVAPAAFQFEVPKDAKLVQSFIPPHPGQLMGEKLPPFRFFDLNQKPVTSESLAGKIAVLNFWVTWSEPSRKNMPELQKVFEQFRGNDKVVFLNISVDRPDVDGPAIEKTLKELGVDLPVVRDQERCMGPVFHTADIPFLFIMDGKGVGQDFEDGINPQGIAALPEKINQLLGGADIFAEPRKRYEKDLTDYQAEQQRRANPSDDASQQIDVPEAKIAPRSEPSSLRLTPLWTCTEVKAPGNILVVGSPGGAPNDVPRLLVVDAWKSVAEVGLDGKVLAAHPLKLEQSELVSNLRSATAADGKRYFATFASAQQRFHLLDGSWNPLASYPEDALTNPHSGISDVQLGDLDGDGVPEACVGYWGVVGVQAVSIQGKRLWSNRSVTNVGRIAIGEPDAQGKRSLFCTNNTGSLAVIDAAGGRTGEVALPGQLLHFIAAADLNGDGKLLWCGLAAPQLGSNVAVGLDLTGKELWRYPLPVGVHRQPVEPVVAGRLSNRGPGQWLLPAADGSIHILAADGTPLDRFNYGAPLAGLATAEVDGRPVLIVSSTGGLQAWKVE